MRTSWIAAFLLGGWALAHAADEKSPAKPVSPPAPQTPAQKLEALESEFAKQKADIFKQYQAIKTPADREKVFSQFRTAIETTSRQVMALAEANPKDAVAIKALTWILSQPDGKNDQITRALAWIGRDFVTRPDILPICQELISMDSPEAEAALRAIHEKNPGRDVRGVAGYGLAIKLLERSDERPAAANKAEAEKLRREAEQQFEDVIAKYGDVPYRGRTLGKKSQAFLFEIRNLGIGMKAPDIQGSDSDGKSFKLSDYRGKVVVLDFWARW
jgi:hypothetical protein